MAGLDSLHKFYLDVLYGNTINREHLERLSNQKMKNNRGIARDKFDVVSCQFAMQYFFKSTESIHTFMTNLAENLKLGGKFIASFFDGSKVFELLKSKKKVEHKDEDGRLLWRIEKKYEITKFTNDTSCLSLPISVYMETFTKSFDEYLINIDYLEEIMPVYGLEIQNKNHSQNIPRKFDFKNYPLLNKN